MSETPEELDYPVWDGRCSEILQREAGRCTNAEIAALIAAATGKRFSVWVVSRKRSALGLGRSHRNAWSAIFNKTKGR
jgi:hypothetical protein